MSATAFGVVLGLGALGAAAGALTAPTLVRRYGPGPMMLTALVITPLTQVPLLLASPGLRWQIAVAAALFLQLACAGAAGTTQRSIRQIVTTAGMQARMQAVSTWLTAGARPVAALLAGGLGTWIGVRPTLTAGTFLLLVPLVVLARSPLRALRHMPNQPAAAPGTGGDPVPPPTLRTAPPAVPTPARTEDDRHDRSPGGDAT
ncbi:MFS transporter [Streptomyces sp. NPDC003032]